MSNLVFVGNSFPSGLKMPTVIQGAGASIQYRYIEFYTVRLRNYNTRMAYYRALNQFFDWLSHHDATLDLTQVNSIMVAAYLEEHPGSIPSRNQHLAAIRALFNWFVQAGILTVNPAQAVKGFKHKAKRGKTPILSDREVLQLLDSIETNHLIGLRDRALIATLFFSCARISAVLKMNVRDYFPIGDRVWFRLHEKGGHYHEVPVHAYAQGCMDTYLERGKLIDKAKSPLFQTLPRGQHTLSGNRFKRQEAWGMIKRRAKQAGILTEVCVHSFRASGITNFLNNGGSREQAQHIAAHEDIRSTALYDHRPNIIAETAMDRISL